MPFDGMLREITPGISVIRRARELIEESGWNQGQGRGPGGQYCIMSALYCAGVEVTDAFVNPAPFIDASARVMEALGIPHTQLHVWNDAPDRTRADVLGLLDRAILEDIS